MKVVVDGAGTLVLDGWRKCTIKYIRTHCLPYDFFVMTYRSIYYPNTFSITVFASFTMKVDIPLYLAVGGVFVTYYVVVNYILPVFTGQAKFVNSTPWVGVKKQWFSRYRAGIAAVRDTTSLMLEGYEKVRLNHICAYRHS